MRDWTFAFTYFFNPEKQVRESPGLGRWETEKENPVGPSLEDSNRFFHITLVRQNTVQSTVRPRFNKTRNRKRPPRRFLLSLNSPGDVTFTL